MPSKDATLEKIVAWSKRRGFVYQTSDIYGGLANNYDYGPYGTQLKNNIRDLWWKKFVLDREDIVGLDGAIITHPRVWEASGHTENFNDLIVEDKQNNKRYRADHIIEDKIGKLDENALNRLLEAYNDLKKKNGGSFPIEFVRLQEIINSRKFEGHEPEIFDEIIDVLKLKSPDGNELGKVKALNQLFETHIGAFEDDKDVAYLRGETAQSIFQNFQNVVDSMRVRVPFGIAQIGKAFRNEITKGQFLFRTIEFEQMEVEYFIDPKSDWEPVMKDLKQEAMEFYMLIGAPLNDLRFREHLDEELSHYSIGTFDIEYNFDYGWKEMAGIAHRTDFDLSRHSEFSGKNLKYRDPVSNEVYTPHVLEPSFGLSRAVIMSMYAAYTEEDLGDGKSRVVLKFPKHLAPVTAAIFPLQKDEKLQDLAKSTFEDLKQKFVMEYDNAGNIGKMYRRQDEIGTPFCITIDFDSLEDKSATVRDRDTMKQERVKLADLESYLQKQIEG